MKFLISAKLTRRKKYVIALFCLCVLGVGTYFGVRYNKKKIAADTFTQTLASLTASQRAAFAAGCNSKTGSLNIPCYILDSPDFDLNSSLKITNINNTFGDQAKSSAETCVNYYNDHGQQLLPGCTIGSVTQPNQSKRVTMVTVTSNISPVTYPSGYASGGETNIETDQVNVSGKYSFVIQITETRTSTSAPWLLYSSNTKIISSIGKYSGPIRQQLTGSIDRADALKSINTNIVPNLAKSKWKISYTADLYNDVDVKWDSTTDSSDGAIIHFCPQQCHISYSQDLILDGIYKNQSLNGSALNGTIVLNISHKEDYFGTGVNHDLPKVRTSAIWKDDWHKLEKDVRSWNYDFSDSSGTQRGNYVGSISSNADVYPLQNKSLIKTSDIESASGTGPVQTGHVYPFSQGNLSTEETNTNGTVTARSGTAKVTLTVPAYNLSSADTGGSAVSMPQDVSTYDFTRDLSSSQWLLSPNQWMQNPTKLPIDGSPLKYTPATSGALFAMSLVGNDSAVFKAVPGYFSTTNGDVITTAMKTPEVHMLPAKVVIIVADDLPNLPDSYNRMKELADWFNARGSRASVHVVSFALQVYNILNSLPQGTLLVYDGHGSFSGLWVGQKDFPYSAIASIMQSRGIKLVGFASGACFANNASGYFAPFSDFVLGSVGYGKSSSDTNYLYGRVGAGGNNFHINTEQLVSQLIYIYSDCKPR